MTLASGRRIGCCTWGEDDAPAVVYFHGMPGSRLEMYGGRPALERREQPLRLVGLDRPGYGRSSPPRLSGYRGWGGELAEVADRLGLDEFAVLGFSGGAPWALACALELGGRVTRVGLVGALAPPDTPGIQGAACVSEDGRSPGRAAFGRASISVASRIGLADRVHRRGLAGMCPPDRVAMSVPDTAALSGWVLRDGFARWGRTLAMEAELARRDWDFDPGSVRQPIHLWHGDDDPVIPTAASRDFAARLHDAALTTWPAHGHLSWRSSDRFDEVLDWLSPPP